MAAILQGLHSGLYSVQLCTNCVIRDSFKGSFPEKTNNQFSLIQPISLVKAYIDAKNEKKTLGQN